MQLVKIISFILALCCWSTTSFAEDIELGGIVLDRSISRFGKDFAFYYAGYWRDMPQTEGITVVIHERVYPQAGTFLWVEINQTRIYQTYFGRRHNDVKQMAEQAILLSVNELANIQAAKMFGEQPDLSL